MLRRAFSLATVVLLLASPGLAEVADVLASLPEDPTLEDLVPSQIAYMERTRMNRRRVSEILASLPTANIRVSDSESGDPTSVRRPPAFEQEGVAEDERDNDFDGPGTPFDS